MSKKHAETGKATPAIAQLEEAGINFRIAQYEHDADHMDDGYGVEAAEKLGVSAAQVCKTLMVDTGEKRVVGIVPVNGRLNMKAIAAAVHAKKASMTSPEVAQRESGYVVGGISPFGQKTKHETVLDTSVMQFDEILVSGGKRGLDVVLNPQDIVTLLNATVADIAA